MNHILSGITLRVTRSSVIGATFSIGIAILSMLVWPPVLHWFIVPVSLCGCFLADDAVRWISGQIDPMDPRGMIGIMGIHFFFIAPILHVAWDMHTLESVPNLPPDWRPWLGAMAFLNLTGLFCYRFFCALGSKPTKRVESRHWNIDRRAFSLMLPMALTVSLASQFYVFLLYQGLDTSVARTMSFAGTGWLLVLSEPWPILGLIGMVVFVRFRTTRRRSVFSVAVVLLLFLLFVLLSRGVRGSRSSVIWALFWMVGIIHFFVRPFRIREFVAGALIVVLFMYIYGFYKTAGLEVAKILTGEMSIRDMETLTGRNARRLILGDLARADVQALVLYRIFSGDVDLQMGLTYVGDASIVVPQVARPSLTNKSEAGTNALYGRGSYRVGVYQATRVYGLAGEAMLNFGPVGVPLAFAVWGFLVGRLRQALSLMPTGDSRFLFAPFLVLLCLNALAGDFDGVVFSIVKDGLLTFALVWLASKRTVDRSASIGTPTKCL